MAQIIRVSATFACVYRLRTNNNLECLVDEVSVTVGRKGFLEMYSLATREPSSFLYVNLASPKINDMWYIKLNQKLHID